MVNRLAVLGILGLVGGVVATVGSVVLFDFVTVKGNELGVVEGWGGINPVPVQPSTDVYKFTNKVYHYDMSSQVFVMNDVTAGEKGKGRDADAYLVQSADQQDMHISLNVRWRLDPAKIVDIHKTYHAHMGNADHDIIEERLIRPTVMFIVKNHATKMKAIEAYSGEGLVRLQTEIEKDLASSDSELRKQGVIVENFVMEKIALDSKYVDEIKARQIAMQKQSRAVEETKAAEADALKAKAEAQADLNRMVVAAERDKQVAILKAEQESAAMITASKARKEQTVLAAEAEAEKVTIAANAEKAAAEARADAIKALGIADAEKQKLMFSAYSVPGTENYVRIQVAQNMATAFSGIKGYLPSDMKINLLSDNFYSSVQSLMGARMSENLNIQPK
jgi:regulator of protease activity HflC (stomatin/prohibitin superfamily)